MESLFNNISSVVEKKIEVLDKSILEELKSLYLNLVSKNSSDWVKVAHSCRRVLKFIADKVFPASDEKYITKDKREWQVKDNNFLNRLICFFDKEGVSNISKSEVEFVEKYIRAVTSETQDGVHKNEITHFEASTLAIHTYLILSQVLNNLTSQTPEIKES